MNTDTSTAAAASTASTDAAAATVYDYGTGDFVGLADEATFQRYLVEAGDSAEGAVDGGAFGFSGTIYMVA